MKTPRANLKKQIRMLLRPIIFKLTNTSERSSNMHKRIDS